MATFNYQVDRVYNVVAPTAFSPDVDLKGEAFTLQPGESLVYRGLIELGGQPRYTFDYQGKKAFSPDRAAIERGLEENYDELMRP